MIQDRLILVGVAALSAVATAGWVRQTPDAAAPQALNFRNPSAVDSEPLPLARTAAYDTNSEAAPMVVRRVADDGYNGTTGPVQRVYDDRALTSKRSTGKSVAIVAGSAAAAAAIGGMAGGGKGAAIGAMTGGAGGYIYD